LHLFITIKHENSVIRMEQIIEKYQRSTGARIAEREHPRVWGSRARFSFIFS